MHDFGVLVLRQYYAATGWNGENGYGYLTRPIDALLDFPVPRGLHLAVANSPNASFATAAALHASPALAADVAYAASSAPIALPPSPSIALPQASSAFAVPPAPRRPVPKDEEWRAGERVDTKDWLLYGRLYAPASRLDALAALRMSPTMHGLAAAISRPPPAPSSLLVSVHHDTGPWATDASYSADDGMWGLRVLHNFSPRAPEAAAATRGDDAASAPPARVDSEDAMGGLRGRFSVGAELYVSAREKSAGLSTGVRFTTLDFDPAQAPPPTLTNTQPSDLFTSPTLAPAEPTHSLMSSPSPSASTSSSQSLPTLWQPPTVLTALFNPMLGHLSASYAARVGRDVALASRFGFNMYSYESEWTMGVEWWLRKAPDDADEPAAVPLQDAVEDDLRRPGLGDEVDKVEGLEEKVASAGTRAWERVTMRDRESDSTATTSAASRTNGSASIPPGTLTGVVKARASTNRDLALLWEGRVRNMLVALGVVGDFSSRTRPIRAIGLELAYYSAD
ncbi:uncharacterized protein SCHCODRAFT_02623675 [Schizophyllum commune H4-8]|uniref:uncharacterized protein n=1 Tax=Schizophyllum commune (strain H4-8 / FGSC 9210) TaxID=578458 RepID=UPI002160D4A4|nr:uncharacterized protein SCHCODRAFT_02623675 [Schizophyllum commune H4-8]KAI5894084.1 hypothetical protein SCHCODRAFT_02623675 [Schizophyllum commune H4-8]